MSTGLGEYLPVALITLSEAIAESETGFKEFEPLSRTKQFRILLAISN